MIRKTPRGLILRIEPPDRYVDFETHLHSILWIIVFLDHWN